MEAFLLLLDALVMLVVAYMGLMDDRRSPKEPARSFFRMRANRFDKTEGAASPARPTLGRGYPSQGGRGS